MSTGAASVPSASTIAYLICLAVVALVGWAANWFWHGRDVPDRRDAQAREAALAPADDPAVDEDDPAVDEDDHAVDDDDPAVDEAAPLAPAAPLRPLTYQGPLRQLRPAPHDARAARAARTAKLKKKRAAVGEAGPRKKPRRARASWSDELCASFLNVYSNLADDMRTPKQILNGMNVEGLTRDQVKGHLQRHRQRLQRLEIPAVAAEAAGDYAPAPTPARKRKRKLPGGGWSDELHANFLNVYNELDDDERTPEEICDRMEIEGLTREQVARHLKRHREDDEATATRKRKESDDQKKRRIQTVNDLREHRLAICPHLREAQMNEGQLFWKYTCLYFIKTWEEFGGLTLDLAVQSRRWLIYFGITRQKLLAEVFRFLFANGQIGKDGHIYRSTLVLQADDPLVRPHRRGPRKGKPNVAINTRMALDMGFKYCEVFAGRTVDNVDSMETWLQLSQERSAIEAGTCDVINRAHGTPHFLHRHWTNSADSKKELAKALEDEPLESMCTFMSYAEITPESSANLLVPLFLPNSVLNPKRDLNIHLVGGQTVRHVP